MPTKSLASLSAEIRSESLFCLVDVVFPGQANHHGTLFGGSALAMMDKFAFVLASRHLRRTVVTAALTETDFRAPVPVGHLAEVDGRVVRSGRRSVEIEAELVAENMLTGERTSCLTGRFFMVGQESDAAPEPKLKPLAEGDATAVRVVEIVFPGQTNHCGILHGGFALDWLSKAALVAASRRARQTVLMVSTKTLDFVAPARIGDIVETTARVIAVGRTSLTIETLMTAECPQAGERRICTRAEVIFVAIDDNGRPTPVRTSASSPSS